MAQRPVGDPKLRAELRRQGKVLQDITAGDALLDALEEAEGDERALAQLKANPKAHLQGKGLRIPDEMSVESTEGLPWGIRLSITGEGGVHSGVEARSGERGPETDPKDRGRFKRLDRQVHDDMASDTDLDALEEGATNAEARAKMKANPKAYLKGRGLTISDEVDVEVTEGSLYCHWHCYGWWIFRICYIHCWWY